MSDEKKPPAPPAPGTPPTVDPNASPETQAAARVSELTKQVTQAEQEIRIMHGKFTNRSPARVQELKTENAAAKKRVETLQKALFGLLMEGFEPRQADDFNLKFESLRQATIEFCKQSNIDPEIWKKIAY